MLLHGHKSFQPIRHGRYFHLQQCLGERGDHLIRRVQCGLVLAQKHGAVELEMVVVAAVERVKIIRSFPVQVFSVCGSGLGV